MVNSTVDRAQALIDDLFPICRSITGPGLRATLDRIGEEIPITRQSVPSGTPVLDWVVPDEWEIRDGYISYADDPERLVDFRRLNLHVVGYSNPIRERMTFDELRPHLYTLPDQPDLVPYRTGYYSDSWGFCLSHDELQRLAPDAMYDVVIDSEIRPGSVEWGELIIPGTSDQVVVLTTHICHPSLCNDNLTGIAAMVEIARSLLARTPEFTYRLLFIPGTIGSICWLATNPEVVPMIRHGLCMTGLGDSSGLTYKASRRDRTEIDRMARLLLRDEPDARSVAFSPYGYDERQFCSPGYNLAFGRMTRGVHGEYPQYHTSADNLSFISLEQMRDATALIIRLLEALEANNCYVNLQPFGEPRLGTRGLFRRVAGDVNAQSVEVAYLWLLNGSDGTRDLCSIAEEANLPWPVVAAAADRLVEAGLLATAGEPAATAG